MIERSEVAKSNPVKDDIDAQSGRFEFFKLTSTLGTAGLAGMAALFTDSTKIPSDLGSLILAGSCGVFFILTIFACVSGQHSYANLLSARARITIPNALPESETTDLEKRIREYSNGIRIFSRLAYIMLLCTGLALLGFASLSMFYHSSVTPDAALDVARKLVSKEVGRENYSIQLEHFGADGGEFLIKYGIHPGLQKYFVRMRKTGQVEEIGRAKTDTQDTTNPIKP